MSKMPETVKRLPGAIVRRVMGVLRPSVKVKLTRRNLYLSYPGKATGEFYVLPRPGSAGFVSFTITENEDKAYELLLREPGSDLGTMSLGSFASREDAQVVLSKINHLLTGSQIGKWSVRALLLWFIYLFVTSYMQVSQQSGNDVAAVDPAAFVPPPNTGFQELPSVAAAQPMPGAPADAGANLSNYIYEQAMAAKAKAEQESMPPKAGGETAGLDGFGLDSGASPNGPGCDPKLAFTAPKQ